jgi:hypothetical protein
MIKLKKIPKTNALFSFLLKINKVCANSTYCSDCKYVEFMKEHCIFDISPQWVNVYKEGFEFEENFKGIKPSIRNLFVSYATNCSLMCGSEKACICKIIQDYGICPSRIETWGAKEDIWKHRAAVRNLIINRRGEKLDVKKYID